MSLPRRLLIPGSILAAQAANLLIQVLVPRFLSPAEFTAFSLCWTYAQFGVVLVFEWTRNATIRFSAGADRRLSVRRRRVLKRLYLLLSTMLLALAAIAFALGHGWPALATVAGAAVYTACRGLFDGAQAYARARFFNGRFALAWVANSVLSLLLTVTFAWVSGSGVVALLGMSLAFLLSLSFHLATRLFGRLRLPAPDPEQLRFLWRYGAFVALTAMLSAALPPTVRSLAVAGIGHAQSAGLLLALDLSQKVVAAIGMVFNLLFVQYAIRAAEREAPEIVARKIATQTAVAAAVIFPAGIGFWLLQRDLAGLIVPPGYRDAYMASIGLACLCACVFSFRSFGVDALFVVAGRSRYAALGPLAALATACGWILAGAALRGTSLGLVLGGQLAGLVAGCGVSMFLAWKETGIRWPLRDFCIVAAGCALMALAVRALPGAPGPWHAAAALATGAVVYLGFAWALDLCRVRRAGLRV